MKKLKIIAALILLIFFAFSCSNDDDSETVRKEYPENMLHNWEVVLSPSEYSTEGKIGFNCTLKPNGVLELKEGAVVTAIGTWYMKGNIFNCTYTLNSGGTFSYQLIKGKNLFMTGYRGINNEVTGAGKIEMFVV